MKKPQSKVTAWRSRHVELLMRLANPPGYGYYRRKPHEDEESISHLIARGLVQSLRAPPYYILTDKGHAVVERILTAASAIADRVTAKPKAPFRFNVHIGESPYFTARRWWMDPAVKRERWHYGIPYEVDVPRYASGGTFNAGGNMGDDGRSYMSFMSDVLRQTVAGMGRGKRPGLGRLLNNATGVVAVDDDWLNRYQEWKVVKRYARVSNKQWQHIYDIVFARTDKLTKRDLERSMIRNLRSAVAAGIVTETQAARFERLRRIALAPMPSKK